MMTGLFAGVAIGALVGLWGLAHVRRKQLDDLRMFEALSSQFFESAHGLIKDKGTPVEVLEMLEFFNRQITNRRAPRLFYRYVERGLMSPYGRTPSVGSRHSAQSMRAYFDQRRDLEKLFVRAVISALLAMTYLDPRYGRKVRVWLAAIDTAERQEHVASTFADLTPRTEQPEAQPLAAVS